MSLSSSACPSVGKDAATSNSSIVSSLSKKKGTDTQGKLNAINQQLAEVRKKLADRHSSQQVKHHKPKEKQTIQTKRKSAKKTFHHPKLDFVLGEVVFSPYMTKPLDPYPQETFEVPKKLHELKKKVVEGSDVPKDELPYDVDFVRNRFIHEVANFSVSFNMSPVSVSVSVSWLVLAKSNHLYMRQQEERSPISTARSGRRSPLSRQSSYAQSYCLDDTSLVGRSSVDSCELLPPVQSTRRVPSSSGMRSNALKAPKAKVEQGSTASVSSAPRQQQQTPNKEQLLRKPSPGKKKELKPLIPGIGTTKTNQSKITKAEDLNKSAVITKSASLDSSLRPTPVVVKEKVSTDDIGYKDDFSAADPPVAASKRYSSTPTPFVCALSSSDLELMMTSFARMSHLMGR